MMEDIDKVRDELYNYNDNVRGTGLIENGILVYLKKEDLLFPTEYKGYKIITQVIGKITLHNSK